MKKNLFTAVPFLLICLIFGCTFSVKTTFIVEITGEIANNTASEIVLESVFGQKSVPIDNNHFAFEFPDEEIGFYNLIINHHRIPLFVSPGKPLHISLDTTDPAKSVVYSGKTAKESRYLWLHGQVDDHGMGRRVTLEKRVDFYKEYKAHYGQKRKILDSLHGAVPAFDNHFYDMANANINFVSAEERIYFHINQSQNQKVELVKEDFTFLDSIDFNRPEHLHIPNFKRLLSAYVSYKAPKQWMSDIDEVFVAIDESLDDKQVKELAYFMEIDGAIKYKGIEGVAGKLAFFKDYSSNSYFIDTLDKGFQKWTHLLPGNKAPQISVQDKTGRKVSLSDYQGKVVYIDLWATWCAPCKKELPHLATLKDRYKNNPIIEILAISMDNNGESWKSYVEEHQLTGTQLWNEQAFVAEWSKNYLVNGIPRFILIDSDGTLVSATAPRPSQTDKLIPMIDKLLANRGASI